MLCKNLCESFNSHILDARNKPILSLMEGIRIGLMERIVNRRNKMRKEPRDACCPMIRMKVEETVMLSRGWKPIWHGQEGYQVMGPRDQQFVVDLRKNTCSCEALSLTGIPCVHSIAAFHKKGLDPHDHVHTYYKFDKYVQLYDNILIPINGRDMWPRSNSVVLDPPRSFVQPGRPRKARKRQLDKNAEGRRRIRRRVVISCTKCKEKGHNRLTCPQLRVEGGTANKQPRRKRRRTTTTETNSSRGEANQASHTRQQQQ